MICFDVDAVLLDVEGTTSSISFVHDKMFPYARQRLAEYCTENWNEPSLQNSLELLAKDALYADTSQWFQASATKSPVEVVVEFAEMQMDQDSKATGLKTLQGLIWKSGFESGELRSHLFEDVPEALKKWHSQGLRLAIYSSGSIAAQRLFFGHTTYGDFNPLISANFDTTTGPKRESDSYRKISNELKLAPERILFLSDIATELQAASDAGLKTVATVRAGNAPLPAEYSGQRVESFETLKLA